MPVTEGNRSERTCMRLLKDINSERPAGVFSIGFMHVVEPVVCVCLYVHAYMRTCSHISLYSDGM